MLKKMMSFLLALAALTTGSSAPADKVTVTEQNYREFLTLTNTYPHNNSSFTQGLFFHNGIMYETTGRYGESMLYKNIELQTGNAELSYEFDDNIFAEGSVVFDDTLYVLTYKENKVLTFHPETLEPWSTYSYPRQGWGITTDGEHLIASDGSSKLYFMDKDLDTVSSLEVTRDGEPLDMINELEYINGQLWANIWLTDEIVIIDKKSGKVVRTLDFSGLYDNKSSDPNDVLNGIAYDSDSGRIYITGKNWDTVFEFELE